MWKSPTSTDNSCPAQSCHGVCEPTTPPRDKQLCGDRPAAFQRSHSSARYAQFLYSAASCSRNQLMLLLCGFILLFCSFQALVVPWQAFLYVLVLPVPQLIPPSRLVAAEMVCMMWTSTPSLLRRWLTIWIPQPLVNEALLLVVMSLQTHLLINATGCYELFHTTNPSTLLSSVADQTADED